MKIDEIINLIFIIEIVLIIALFYFIFKDDYEEQEEVNCYKQEESKGIITLKKFIEEKQNETKTKED